MQDSENTLSDNTQTTQTNHDSNPILQALQEVSNKQSLQEGLTSDTQATQQTNPLESTNIIESNDSENVIQEESDGIPESIFNEISAVSLHTQNADSTQSIQQETQEIKDLSQIHSIENPKSHKTDSIASTQQEKILSKDSKEQQANDNSSNADITQSDIESYNNTESKTISHDNTTLQDSEDIVQQPHKQTTDSTIQENATLQDKKAHNQDTQENIDEKNQEKTQVREDLTKILQNIETTEEIDDAFIEEIIYNKKTQKRKKKHKRFKRIKINWSYILYSKRLFASITILACFIGLYTGYLLFGSTSLEVLWRLHTIRDETAKEVEQHRLENATLQKKVLELQALEPH